MIFARSPFPAANCDTRTGSSSSPDTLQAALGERAQEEKGKDQPLGEKCSQTSSSSRQPWPPHAQTLNTNLPHSCK